MTNIANYEATPTQFDDRSAKFSEVNNFVQTASFGDDSKTRAVFYWRKEENDFRPDSESKGEIFCKIIIPGNTSLIHDQPVRDVDKVRFPQQWRAFMNNQEQGVSGIPIENWGHIAKHPQQVQYLKLKNIDTVEQLAALSDTLLGEIGHGAHSLREEARKFVVDANNGAQIRRVESAEDKIARLERIVEKMAADSHTEQQTEVAAAKRGRPPKKEEKDGNVS